MIEGIQGQVAKEKTQAMLEATVSEHKNRLIKLKDDGGLSKHVESATDLVFSLRLYGLQAPNSE